MFPTHKKKKKPTKTPILCTVTGRIFTYTKARSKEMLKEWRIWRTGHLYATESSIWHFSIRWSWQVWGPLSLCMCDQTRLLWWPLEEHSRCWTCAAAASSPTPPPPSSWQRFWWCSARQKKKKKKSVKSVVVFFAANATEATTPPHGEC